MQLGENNHDNRKNGNFLFFQHCYNIMFHQKRNDSKINYTIKFIRKIVFFSVQKLVIKFNFNETIR